MLALALAPSLVFPPRRGRAEPARARREAEPDTVVVTGTRTPERSQRATVKTDVVTKDEADRRGATNVAEALATQSGVQVNPGAYGYLGGVSAIQIQGFDRDRVLVLEDGERIVGDVGGAIDLASLPTADLARIEVVTGPTSSLYGSSAIGGVVNIVTAPPTTSGLAGRGRLEARSYRGMLGQTSVAYRSRDTWAGVDLQLTKQGAILQGGDVPDTRLPATTRTLVGLRGGFALAPRIDVRVRLRWLRDRLDGVSSAFAPGLGRFVTDVPEETNRRTAHIIETIDLGGGSNLRLTAGRQWIDGRSDKDRRGSPLDEQRTRRHRMSSFELVGTFADGPRTWVLGARGEAERFEQSLARTTSQGGRLQRDEDAEVVPQALANGALYGQLAYKPSSKLTFLPGVRTELHSRYGGSLAPRLATSFRPASALLLRLSAGRGFRAPSAKELGFVFDHSFYGYRVAGNGELRPETSWGVNADATWLPTPAITARLGGFGNWVDHLIDVDLGTASSADGVTEYRYVNYGRARTFGAQTDLAYRLGDGLKSELSYAYLWTRDDRNDRPLTGRPAHTVTASLRATLLAKLDINVRWRVNSDAYLTETSRAPGYTTFDVRLARPLFGDAASGNALEAYAGVQNLLDAHQEAGRVGDTRPPLGRVFYAGVRGAFTSDQDP
jgi:outer membrane receptor for ferrienterochelin and colicins